MTTTAEYNALVDATMSEKELQTWVLGVARQFGWLAYHTRDSRGSQAGFPDLVLTRGTRLLFAELKREKGKLSADQEAWFSALANTDCQACGFQACDVYIWRPSDRERIMEALR